MRTAEPMHQQIHLKRQDLKEMAAGHRENEIDDMAFLETLATNHCMVMPPYVYHVNEDGTMQQVTPVRYDDHYNLNKAAILLALLEKLPRMKCS
jgi:hypothetical protein